MADKLIKPRQVADRLGVSERTLSRWRTEKREIFLPFVQFTDTTVRYKESDVEAFIDARYYDNIDKYIESDFCKSSDKIESSVPSLALPI